jgi:hypothetical protein
MKISLMTMANFMGEILLQQFEGWHLSAEARYRTPMAFSWPEATSDISIPFTMYAPGDVSRHLIHFFLGRVIVMGNIYRLPTPKRRPNAVKQIENMVLSRMVAEERAAPRPGAGIERLKERTKRLSNK